MAKRKLTKLSKAVIALLFLAGAGGLALFIVSEPLPIGTPGAEADALAKKMQQAAGLDGWSETGAIRFFYAGRHKILWDRKRGYARVAWKDREVLFDVKTKKGVAFDDGQKVASDKSLDLIDDAYKHFINDTYWLNPLVSFFDDGVTRSLVTTEDGTKALLITYASGGVTPGESYLFIPGPDGLLMKWKMWVRVLPIGGVAVTWERWKTLPTGVKIATLHDWPLRFEIEVDGARTLEELVSGKDPFAALANGN